MKKTLLTLIFILVSYYLISISIEENIKIPDDAIRIRVLANSNSEYDQQMKLAVKQDIQDYMYNLLLNVENAEEASDKIYRNLEHINKEVEKSLQILDYSVPYKVNFGLNYFPEKKYKGVTYDEGYYESLLITLGKGEGDNWWCVLFPPLCLIEAEESTEVEYKSFVKELLDKYV